MGLITNLPSSIAKSSQVVLGLDTDLLLGINKVSSNTFYNQKSNWKQVRVIFEHALGKQRRIVNFENSGSDVFTGGVLSFLTNSRSGTWNLARVILIDYDDATLKIFSSDLPNFNFTLI